MRVDKLTPDQWKQLSEYAHVAVFGQMRPAYRNRIDYALLVAENKADIIGFMTIRELDDVSVYWQYGGALPNYRNSPKVFKAYCNLAEWCFASGVQHVSTLVLNTNIPMLKFALKIGFVVVGVRVLKDETYLDLMLTGNLYDDARCLRKVRPERATA